MSSERKTLKRNEFKIGIDYADMLVNHLLEGEYETIGRIFTDLVNYNLYGDQSITEPKRNNKFEYVARALFREDSDRWNR